MSSCAFDKNILFHSKRNDIIKYLELNHLHERIMNITILKWLSSLLVLTGVLCTNLNIYPYNIYFQSVGAVSWVMISFYIKDRSLMINFLPQLPLFAIGYYLIFTG